MSELQNDLAKWEEAYLKLAHEALVGRLFKGLLHNLNGVAHSYAMQTDILSLMFPRGFALLDKIEEQFSGSPPDEVFQLKELLQGRANLIEQAFSKVQSAQEILRRVPPLSVFRQSLQTGEISFGELVSAVIEFYTGDPFFKHKVKKNVNMQIDFPFLNGNRTETYQLLSSLVENAIESFDAKNEHPEITVATMMEGGNIILIVQDSGGGIPEGEVMRIFEPFYTTKEDHAGLGLYFAKKNIEKCGGHIHCQSQRGLTIFTVSMPSSS